MRECRLTKCCSKWVVAFKNRVVYILGKFDKQVCHHLFNANIIFYKIIHAKLMTRSRPINELLTCASNKIFDEINLTAELLNSGNNFETRAPHQRKN